MKITCTKAEKSEILDALMEIEFCLHPNNNESCVYDSGCWDCLEQSIEWQIEEDNDNA